MKYYLVSFLVFAIIDISINLFMEYYCAKKCKYDCSKCKNWRCYKNYCDRKRETLNEKW